MLWLRIKDIQHSCQYRQQSDLVVAKLKLSSCLPAINRGYRGFFWTRGRLCLAGVDLGVWGSCNSKAAIMSRVCT